jgi:hypothetical protein
VGKPPVVLTLGAGREAGQLDLLVTIGPVSSVNDVTDLDEGM